MTLYMTTQTNLSKTWSVMYDSVLRQINIIYLFVKESKMFEKVQTRSRKSIGFNTLTLKQPLIHPTQQSKTKTQNQKTSDILTVSTRIASNLSSHKNSVDQSVNRFRGFREIKLTTSANTQDTSVVSKQDSPKVSLQRNVFSYEMVLGKGGFGRVWRVQMKKTGADYALKEMSKALIITKKSVPSVMNQKSLLSKLKHPFLVNMVASFQDRQSLYLVMDLMPGGDLRHHIGRRRRFTQQQTKFITANIFICLEYLHQNNVIHRDIKPQNIVFDGNGYLRVTDLGIARFMKSENSSDTSGTPGYMAPEVLCRQNHTFSVDYFAMGVIVYELMLGKRPYNGRSRKEIRDDVLAKQAQVRKQEIPEGWSMEAADFVNRLIQRKQTYRLGHGSSSEIRKHPWLRNFPWEKLMNKTLKAPFIPNLQRNYLQQQVQVSSENTQTKELMAENIVLLRRPQVQELFKGYEQPFTHLIQY